MIKRSKSANREQEPVGIVISRGARSEELPVVWAYVWGPAPEAGDPPIDPKAA